MTLSHGAKYRKWLQGAAGVKWTIIQFKTKFLKLQRKKGFNSPTGQVQCNKESVALQLEKNYTRWEVVERRKRKGKAVIMNRTPDNQFKFLSHDHLPITWHT